MNSDAVVLITSCQSVAANLWPEQSQICKAIHTSSMIFATPRVSVQVACLCLKQRTRLSFRGHTAYLSPLKQQMAHVV